VVVHGVNSGDDVYAIVMSGEYKDDQDHGSSFTYTGMGQQKGGHQVGYGICYLCSPGLM
jgi:hypothetical protein